MPEGGNSISGVKSNVSSGGTEVNIAFQPNGSLIVSQVSTVYILACSRQHWP